MIDTLNFATYFSYTDNPLRIKMRYHHAPDYPLDIYYLMDSSKSLMEEKLVLSFGSLGTELKKKVSKLTRDLRLGFGSFVEKPVPPFIDYDPEKWVFLFKYLFTPMYIHTSSTFVNKFVSIFEEIRMRILIGKRTIMSL